MKPGTRGHRTASAVMAVLAALAASPLVAQPMDDETATVLKRHEASYGELCFGIGTDGWQETFPVERWPLTWTPEWSDTPQSLALYRLFCFTGAYNATHIYYAVSDDPAIGIQPLAFARPAFEVIYENDDFDAAVLEIVVEGIGADVTLVNSDFDPDTGILTENLLWRGVGDASSTGTWRFHNGGFVLRTFDVDASYDGAIDQVRIVDFTSPGAAP